MKRTFKLIKDYPGSPKIGTIAKVNGFGLVFPNIFIQDIDNGKFKEYVEEVSKYLVLSKYKNSVIVSNNEGVSDFNTNGWSIRSIKRLSDGEIFNIGDKIRGHTYSGVIEHINLSCFDFGAFNVLTSDSDCVLRVGIDISNAKKLIMTTEDGVDIFDDERVYYIGKDNKVYSCTPTSQAAKENICHSSKEVAKSKKPRFAFTSQDDVNIYAGDTYYYVNSTKMEIETRVAPSDYVDFYGVNGCRFANKINAERKLVSILLDNADSLDLAFVTSYFTRIQ